MRFPGPPKAPLEVHVAERALVIALRPGDDTVSAAGLMQRVIKRIGTVSVALVSAGESAPPALATARAGAADYAKLRVREARAAGRLSSRGAARVQVFGFPDAQLAALGCGPEFQAALPNSRCASRTPARASEPGLSALARTVRESIVRALSELPTLVVFPDVRAGSADQRALGAITMLALREHMRGRSSPWPRTLTFSAAPEDVQSTDEPDLRTRLCLPLSDQERERKRQALAAHESQRRVLPAFARDEECFTENTLYDVEMIATRLREPARLSALHHPR